MTVEITTHQVYQVTIAIAPNYRRLAFERTFLGLPNKTQVQAYIRRLIQRERDKGTSELSLLIRRGYEKCLGLLDAYGLPSVATYPQGAIMKPGGYISIKKMKNVIQVEESR